MPNINRNPYYRAQLGRFGHDMKEHLEFSAICSQLLPISYDILSPGEKLRINDSTFIRTETLTSSAFVRLRYRLEYFFVPMPQLYSYFGSLFYGVNDFHSAQFTSPKNVKFTNQYPNFTLKQLEEFANTWLTVSKKDSQGFPYLNGLKRLLDCFGLGSVNLNEGQSNNNRASFLPFQAYQRIWDAFYRNDMYTPTNRLAYNVDDLLENFDADYTTHNMNSLRFNDIFEIRYRNYPRDYFTNVQQSPLFNTLSVDSVFNSTSAALFDSSKPYSMPYSSQYYQQNGVPSQSGQNDGDKHYVSKNIDAYSIGATKTYSSASTRLFSVANIRNMFAMEKLLSITQRTKKTYEAQTLAHFGYDVPDQIGNKVFFIGSHDGIIQIQDVNATATTGEGENASRLAEVAGKGIGVTGHANKTLSFTAPWHGVFMCIFSIVPEVVYPNNKFVSRLSQVHRFDDFYHPEYDKLGMMPRYGYEYYARNSEYDSSVVGYSYNYYWLKNKCDRAWGNFLSTNRNWTACRAMPSSGSMNYDLPQSFFYYSPFELNDILLVPVPDSGDDVIYGAQTSYDYDSFMVDIDLNIKKTSSMSTYGLPNL